MKRQESPPESRPESPESVPGSPNTPIRVASVPPGKDDPGRIVAEPALIPSAPEPARNFPLAPVAHGLLKVPAAGADPGAFGAVASGDHSAARVSECLDGGALGDSAAIGVLSDAPVQWLVRALAAAPAYSSHASASASPGEGINRPMTIEAAIPDTEGGVTRSVPGMVVRIEPLTYERPPARATDLELNAELRIHGRAAPNSTIDLFGFAYRVGPGGRFLLTLRVEDADLLRRALEAAPPLELSTGGGR